MRYLTFGVKGVLAWRKPVRIDFRTLPDGIIAIRGRNGEGKTSLVECMFALLYLRFPSRTKSLFDYAFERDAWIEGTFELAGRGVYRARVALDAVARKSEAVMLQVLPDGTERPLTDGKVSTYAAWVREHLPAPELVLASVFGTQKRLGSFATLSRAEAKALFATFLGLARYQRWSETAHESAKVLAAAHDRMQARRSGLAHDLEDDVFVALEGRRAAARATFDELTESERSAMADVAAAEHRLAVATAAARERDAATAAFRQAGTDLEAIAREQAASDEERVRIDAAHVREVDTLRQEAAAASVALQDRLADAHIVLRDGAAIRAAAATLQSVEANLGDLRQQETAARTALQAAETVFDEARAMAGGFATQAEALTIAQEAVAAFDRRAAAEQARDTARAEETAAADALMAAKAVLAEVTAARAAADRAETDLAQAAESAALIGRVPFGEQCLAAACAFVQSAGEQRERLPALQAAVAERPALVAREEAQTRVVAEAQRARDAAVRVAAAAAVLPDLPKRFADRAAAADLADALTASLRGRDAADEALTAARQQVNARAAAVRELAAAIRAEDAMAAEVRPQAQRVVSLEIADAQIAEIDRQLIADAQALARDEAAAAQRAVDARVRQDQRLAALVVARADAEARQRAADEEGARHAVAATDVAPAETALAAARQAVQDARVSRATVEQQIRQLDDQIAATVQRRIEVADLDARLAVLAGHLVDWQTLAQGLGRDGLQTLEIDGSASTISARCNELLGAYSEGRFSIDLVTQALTADGKAVKEAFQVLVHDTRDPHRPHDLPDVSGGEGAVLNEVLQCAIGIYNSERSASPFLNCFRDESDAGLAFENVDAYMPMLRRLQQIAGYRQIFIITHNPDVARATDAQIWCEDGTLRVELPPFGATSLEGKAA